MLRRIIPGTLFVLTLATWGLASPIAVGTGASSAGLVINFKDGAAYEFQASFDAQLTGIGLLELVQANTPLTINKQDFGFGWFIDGISFDGHSNIGYGGGDDWWHYWTRDSADSPWQQSMIGAADRILATGQWDGWVYGRTTAPAVPEPAGLLLFSTALLLLLRNRRNRPATPICTCAPLVMLALIASGPIAHSALLTPSDFAVEVVDYVEGAGMIADFLTGQPFNNPLTALGRPTVDTTGDGFNIALDEPAPVVPLYGPFRASELVTIGQGGRLVVKFDHAVTNDPANPFGLDLIVFGNAAGVAADYWANRNPAETTLQSALRAEAGVVSVSQDGQTWHTFADGPYADTFAPTLGRTLNSAHPDPSLGQWNQWWGQPTDPTLPLDPSITMADLAGLTVAQAASLYGRSAGGTAFDIGLLGLDWIQYVRVENPLGSGLTPEIDAFADVAAIPEPRLAAIMLLLAASLRRVRRAA